jgi:transcriptional regulator with XRE-family HTH domain
MTNQSKFLKYAREQINMTRTEMSKKLGVSPQFYGFVENGKAALPPVYFKKFLKITGVGPTDLYEATVEDYCVYISTFLPWSTNEPR